MRIPFKKRNMSLQLKYNFFGIWQPLIKQRNDHMKKERIFVRRIHLKNVFVSEIEAEFAFEINGFRFFYHDRQITDALCGMCVFKQDFSQSKEEYIQRAEYRLRRIFDQYPNAAKKRLRIDWGYKR